VKDNLAACAIYFEEAPYLAEWIEFHRIVGVERFLLYDHESTDDHARVLEPYVEAGVVETRHWPAESGQAAAYDDALERERGRSRWLAFIDVDEFLFSVDYLPLPDALRAFEAAPALCVGRKEFTFSGHVTRPPGLVIESYDRVWPPPAGHTNTHKCVVDPARTLRCISAHSFVFEGGLEPVDGDGQPVHRPYAPRSFPCAPLCLNHYFSKSAEETAERRSRVDAIGRPRTPPKPGFERHWQQRDSADTYPDQLIQHYAPAVRAALENGASRPSRRPSPAP
jgi:hypothetical protein